MSFLDDLEWDGDRDEQDEVRCQYCRERGLYWVNGRLVDREGQPHDCPELNKAASPEEFPE